MRGERKNMTNDEYKKLVENMNVLERNASNKCNFEIHKAQDFYNGYQQGLFDLMKCVEKGETIEDKLKKLNRFVQFDLFTVNGEYVLQLFDIKEDFPHDDGVLNIWQDDRKDLKALLDDAIEWCEAQRVDE